MCCPVLETLKCAKGQISHNKYVFFLLITQMLITVKGTFMSLY